jgi:glyoxylase-like metal-dependent hydrolase (beta-lactamase superfamily II)
MSMPTPSLTPGQDDKHRCRSGNVVGSVVLQDPAIAPLVVTGTVQHAAWTAREVPPVEQLTDVLWSLPVPIPRSPLRYITVYVLATPRGPVLIDAGWESPEGWNALESGLRSCGFAVADVAGVLITHFHFDHLGLAGRVRQESGAWVAMHPADAELLARPDYAEATLAVRAEEEFLISLGATPAEAARVVFTEEEYSAFTSSARPDRLLQDGDLVEVPGWQVRAHHTPGHTPGHVVFHDERSGRLFAGDHVLPRITPNISLERSADRDPLGDYLTSLQRVAELEVDEVLPAHEWRFRGLQARAASLAAHHETRLTELLDALRRHPRSTAWDLAGELTWSRPWEQYDGRMRIFAVTETASHLARLVADGRARATEGRTATFTVAG